MDSVLKVAMQEALQQDHFQQSNLRDLDRKHLREMDLTKVTQKRIMLDLRAIVGGIAAANKSSATTPPSSAPSSPEPDVGKILRTYPSFDPVFMKV